MYQTILDTVILIECPPKSYIKIKLLFTPLTDISECITCLYIIACYIELKLWSKHQSALNLQDFVDPNRTM